MAGLQDVLYLEMRKVLENCNTREFEQSFLKFNVTNKITGAEQQALRRSVRINHAQQNPTFHFLQNT